MSLGHNVKLGRGQLDDGCYIPNIKTRPCDLREIYFSPCHLDTQWTETI